MRVTLKGGSPVYKNVKTIERKGSKIILIWEKPHSKCEIDEKDLGSIMPDVPKKTGGESEPDE